MRRREIMNAHYRREAGVVVSFSTDHGDRLTVHKVADSVADALRECIDVIERHAIDGPWYIEVISTPQTVYQDTVGESRGGGGTLFRERQMLGRIGRLDMLRVPRLNPDTRDEPDPERPRGHAWRRQMKRAGWVHRHKGRS